MFVLKQCTTFTYKRRYDFIGTDVRQILESVLILPTCRNLEKKFATEVTIFSDHNPVMYLRECAPKSAKLTRWALGIQEFVHAALFRNSQLSTLYSAVKSRTEMTVITTVRYQGNAPTDTFNTFTRLYKILTSVCLCVSVQDVSTATVLTGALATCEVPASVRVPTPDASAVTPARDTLSTPPPPPPLLLLHVCIAVIF